MDDMYIIAWLSALAGDETSYETCFMMSLRRGTLHIGPLVTVRTHKPGPGGRGAVLHILHDDLHQQLLTRSHIGKVEHGLEVFAIYSGIYTCPVDVVINQSLRNPTNQCFLQFAAPEWNCCIDTFPRSVVSISLYNWSIYSPETKNQKKSVD